MSLNIEISLNDFYELKNISEKVYYSLKKLKDLFVNYIILSYQSP